MNALAPVRLPAWPRARQRPATARQRVRVHRKVLRLSSLSSPAGGDVRETDTQRLSRATISLNELSPAYLSRDHNGIRPCVGQKNTRWFGGEPPGNHFRRWGLPETPSRE